MIFVVEDDFGIRNMVLYTLNSAGLEAKGFCNGNEFYQEIQNNLPSLILLDLMLPDGDDGLTILSKLKSKENTKQIPVIDEILDYTMRLVSSTHGELEGNNIAKKYLRLGASPRAAQALITGAKVRALMHGNYNVSYEDIDALAYPVLRHRIKLNYDAISEHLDNDAVISLLIKENKKNK